MNTRVLAKSYRRIALACLTCVVSFGTAMAGEVESHFIQSGSLADNMVGLTTNREIRVFLPDSYANSDQSYPVVYWFPGGGQPIAGNIRVNDIEQEFASGRSEEAIIVFMDSRTEFGTSLYLSSDVFGDWQSHLTEEVVPFVDSMYRTNATQEQRAITGFSLGGLTSVLTPIYSPGVFGAVGANDPSIGFISGSVRTSDELPEGHQPSTSSRPISEFFDSFPESVEGYNEAPLGTSAFGQLAVTLSPNPDSALLGDIPFALSEDRESAFFIPDVRETWRQYDLLDENAVAVHAEAYRDLSTVSIALPDTAVNTNRAWGKAMLKTFDEAGISTSGIEAVGDHNDFQHERFVALLGDVTFAMKGENRTTIASNTYAENFNELNHGFANEPETLPDGWSVGLGAKSVFRDRTNTIFDTRDFDTDGYGPHGINLGIRSDRALGTHVAEAEDTAAIQFVANLDELNANALEVSFDIEAWDRVSSLEATDLEQIGVRVSAEFDFGSGFESAIDFGEVALANLSPPSGDLLDGNAAANRESFTLSGGAPFQGAEAIRLLFETDGSLTSPGWTFGIDDVQLDFSFIGDFDSDGELTLDDLNLLGAATRHSGLTSFDVTGDGSVDSADIDFWATSLFGTDIGDTNLDNDVDFSDFLRFASNFGTNNPVVWEDGDFDADGVVGFSDFLAFARGFEATASRSQAQRGLNVAQLDTASVPEPCGNQWVLVALILVSWFHRSPRRLRGA